MRRSTGVATISALESQRLKAVEQGEEDIAQELVRTIRIARRSFDELQSEVLDTVGFGLR